MSNWFARNTTPILIVVLASAVVIGIFEGLDVLAGSEPVPAGAEGGEVELQGLATLAGFVKVFAFLGVGAAIAKLIRGRFKPASNS